uniref:Uncharacterized protein n=1 Tax=Arundo donax TaxID=35708 RepID=A0A0A8ZHF6_ARUDO
MIWYGLVAWFFSDVLDPIMSELLNSMQPCRLCGRRSFGMSVARYACSWLSIARFAPGGIGAVARARIEEERMGHVASSFCFIFTFVAVVD